MREREGGENEREILNEFRSKPPALSLYTPGASARAFSSPLLPRANGFGAIDTRYLHTRIVYIYRRVHIVRVYTQIAASAAVARPK